MRMMALAALAISAASLTAPAQARTAGAEYPVCLHVFGRNTYSECSYSSIAQCNQSAAGRAAQCEVNPYAANAAYDGMQISKRFRRRY